MAAGAVQISNAIQEVNEVTYKNKTSIENLSAEVSRFKIRAAVEQSAGKGFIGIDLNNAIRQHIEWKVKLRDAITLHKKLNAEEISRDDACAFGKWLHGNAKTIYRNSPAFIHCMEKHAVFHREAGAVASTINAGKFAQAEAMLGSDSAFNKASSDVAAAVRVLQQE